MKKENFLLNPCLFRKTFLNYFRSVVALEEVFLFYFIYLFIFFLISLLFQSGLMRSTTHVKMRGIFAVHCTIWYHLCNLENVENTKLVPLQMMPVQMAPNCITHHIQPLASYHLLVQNQQQNTIEKYVKHVQS